MAKGIPDVKFELNQVYSTYVQQLQLAAGVSDFLLGNANLDSAGEQIEGTLRILLKNLLPERVAVTHGHIVDENSKISNQQDVLLTESAYTRSLIKTLDGTEFYPYESIFACGEVKKTWSQDKLIQAVNAITRIKQELSRFNIPADHLSTGTNFIRLQTPLTNNPFRNPLFFFTFSIDFDKSYNQFKLIKVYESVEKHLLPNISVILNRGIIVCLDKKKLSEDDLTIILYPEYAESKSKLWTFIELSAEQCFAYLIFMLTQHVNDTTLEKVSAMKYGKTMIEIAKSSIKPLTS